MTYHRLPIFTNAAVRSLLRTAWLDVQKRFPFITDAICLMPDHLHFIWTLPEWDSDYSMRVREIKRMFTKAYINNIGTGLSRNDSHKDKNEAAIWQRRFWEHTIRDEQDLHNHLNYIHYNPVKHGLVESVLDWD